MDVSEELVNIEIEEEIEFDELACEEIRNSIDIYFNEVGKYHLLSQEEEINLGRLVKLGDEKARKKMIEHNLRLVINIAKRYVKSGMCLTDLIEEGNIGLIKAVERFDPELGFKFSTYAIWWIRQQVERAIHNQGRTVRLPVHVIKKINNCLKTSQKIAKESNCEPKYEQIAEILKKDTSYVENLLKINDVSISIDQFLDCDEDRPLLETFVNKENKDPIQDIEQEKTKSMLSEILSVLNDRQRAIIYRRFGLNGYEEHSLEEVGTDVELTRERVRQIQEISIKKLRNFMTEKGFSLSSFI